MKLVVNKNSFADNLLIPASKLSDNVALKITTESVSTLVTSSDNSTILQAKVPCKGEEGHCIIPDCKAFLRLFSGIQEEEPSLNIESSLISFKSKNFSFKYHLLDENYFATKKSISEEKLDQLQFDTTFGLTKQKLNEILKFNSIIPDAEKLYFQTSRDTVIAKLGDDQKSNTNEIETEVAVLFAGEEINEKLPINIQNILLLSFSGDPIAVSINQSLKIFKFETSNTKYIISGLVK